MIDQNGERAAIAVVYQAQSQELLEILSEKRFPVTLLDAVGGFLREEAVTLVVGVPHRRLPYFFYRVREMCPAADGAPACVPVCYPECQMVEVQVGDASIYVLPVDRFPRDAGLSDAG
jgi:uncharacterized protein YaaQ